MKHIERVVAAMQHQETDSVPVYPLMNGVSRHLTGVDYYTWATDAKACAEAYIKITDELDLDVICTLTDLSVEAADFGQEVIYPANEAAHPNHNNRLIKSVDDYLRVAPLNPRQTPRMSEHIKLCDLLMKAKGQDTPVLAFIFGPLGITSMLRGQQDLYIDLMEDPDAVKHAVAAVNETLMEYCKSLIETGVHAIMIDTLFASKSIMSKSMWMEFEGEYVRQLADYIHSQGCMVMIHNCGHGIYFDVQIETMKPEAISFLHVPDDCADLAETKEKYGNQTTLVGVIPPTWLPNATPSEIEAECQREMDILAPGGGFVLATGCEYPTNMSLDKARVIVDAARSYQPSPESCLCNA